MRCPGYVIWLMLFFLLPWHAYAQTTDTANGKEHKQYAGLKGAVIPAAFITYGIVALNSDQLHRFNMQVRDQFAYSNTGGKKIPIDNFTVAVPAASVYALNIFGIKGRNNFADRTIIFGIANLIGNGAGLLIKQNGHVMRPDSTNNLSFPSGHTLNAFLGAEFLRQEYKDVSPWIGIAGYAVAAGTGYLRIYNNRHWFNDVIAGAGIGILSTRIAYWVYPSVKRSLFHDKRVSTIILPTYESGSYGISLVHYFDH